VANGSVLYLPNSDNVVFRLEVHGAGGQNAVESLRVVGTVKSASLEVSRPVETEEAKNASPARSVAAPGAQLGKKAASGARTQASLPKRERSQKDLVAAKPVPSHAGTNPPVSSNPDSTARVAAVSPPPAAKLERPRENAAPLNSASQNANGTDAVAENQRPTVPSAREAAESPPTNAAGPGGPTHSSDAAKPSEPPAEGAPPRTASLGNASAQIPGPAPTPPGQPLPKSTEPLQTYRPPRPVKQVLPKVSALPPGVVDAVGEVRVLVKVDQSGHVISARLVEGQKKIGAILGTASLAAARQWVFEPASLRGQTIASDHTILFQFRH
jgi:TonB family protein